MSWFVYILRCGNGDFYTGMTSNLTRRMSEHQSGIGGRFTKMLQPVKLVYHERYDTQREAERREIQLKTWSHTKKLALISGEKELLQRV